MTAPSSSVPVDMLLSRLRGVQQNGSGWKALCPAHADRNPSLSIHAAEDGRVLLCCFAGCETERIVGALGLMLTDLFPPRDEAIRANGYRRIPHQPLSPRQPQQAARVDAEARPPKQAVDVRRWPIPDASGRILGVHVRTDYDDSTKDLKWERPDGRPGLGGLSSKDLPLYGIHERRPGQTTIVVEGEPARDALAPLAAALDVAVVATVTGASAVPGDDALRPLLDGAVLLWPDSDEPGETHMDKLHWRLRDLDTTDA